MLLMYTAIYAALLALLLLFLALRVVLLRRKYKVGIGSNQNKELARAIRVHANALEYVPITLLMLAIAEVNGINNYIINGAGIALVLARSLHAYGFSRSAGVSFGRFYGTLLTWLIMIALSICLLMTSIEFLSRL